MDPSSSLTTSPLVSQPVGATHIRTTFYHLQANRVTHIRTAFYHKKHRAQPSIIKVSDWVRVRRPHWANKHSGALQGRSIVNWAQ